MKRPQVEVQPKQRAITGEIVYLDEMRRLNNYPKPFLELGDMAIQMYEAQADMYPADRRPDIMDEYERYDSQPSQVVASCAALANELLLLKDTDSPLTFVDVVVEESPDTVLAKLKSISAGRLLAGEDEQLAIEPDGEYYPLLDIRKQKAKLVGVGVRAWGWDDTKYVFTNQKGEPYKYPQHALLYPSDEKSSTRELEISFNYDDEKAGSFVESVKLYLGAEGSASINSSIWAMAYAETGYEGHKGSAQHNLTDEDIAAFGDLVAEIVGDRPESVAMRINRQLQELASTAATPFAQQAVQELIEATWPAQANYLLHRSQKGNKTIAELLRDEKTAGTATAAIYGIIKEWRRKMQS